MVKVTFTLDEETVDSLRQTAARLQKSKSYVVREAIRDFADRIGNLTEQERRRMLELFDEVVPAIPKRRLSHVVSELERLRVARRGGGRRSPDRR